MFAGDSSLERRRWLALTMVCIAVLMVVLDTTVVNVALPSIQRNLGFSDTGLVWVVNVYLLAFAGSLLLGGRLGDLYGQRRLFLFGVATFTLSSLACGLASTPSMLIMARAVQGMGGAVSVGVALSLIVSMFPDKGDRAKAMSFYSLLSAVGGSFGLLVGGVFTSTLSWNWIFIINLPIGALVYSCCRYLLPAMQANSARGRVDIIGALTITAALMLFVYSIVHLTMSLLTCAAALLCGFLVIEFRSRSPLVPLKIFIIRSFTWSNVVRLLWAAGGYAWFFMMTLYLQAGLGYEPMEVGLAFLPSNVVTALFAAGLLARMVTRYGVKRPLVVGLLFVASGYATFIHEPLDTRALSSVLPGMLLVGLGTGIAFGPLLLAAMKDIDPNSSGLASGILNTVAMLGGTLGIATVATLVSTYKSSLLMTGASMATAVSAGYRIAFVLATGLVCAAALIGAVFLREEPSVSPVWHR